MSLADLADASSFLSGRGVPHTKLGTVPHPMPPRSKVPGRVDFSLDAVTTREKKSGNPLPDWGMQRIGSEWSPVPLPVDPGPPLQVVGRSTRLDGRDPALIVR